MGQYSRRAQFICLAICVLISLQIVTSSPSDYFSNTDRASIKNLLTSSQKKDGSFLGLKNTFYAVSAAQLLGEEPTQKDKICEYTKGALKTYDTESIFYQVSILESLSCGQQVDDKVKTAIKNSLTSNNLGEILNGVSAALVLKKGKHIDVSAAELQAAYNKILTFNDEGLFKANADAVTSVLLTGETLHVLSQIITSGDNAKLTTLLNSAVDSLFTLAEDKKTTFSFSDDQSKADSLQVTASVWRGINSLARALNTKPKAVTQKEVPRIAEFFIQHKNAFAVDHAYFLLEGLNNIANNQFITPLVVTLSQGTSSEGTVKVRVSDIYGNKAVKAQVTLVKAYTQIDKNKPIVTNQEATSIEADPSQYQLTLGTTKPEPGFYNLELRVVPSDTTKFVGADSVIRKLKILGTVSVADAQLIVSSSADPDDINAGKRYKPAFPKQVDEVVALKSGQHLHFGFNLKTQGSDKPATAQQVFLRIGNDQFETIFPVKQSGKGYVADVDADDLNEFYGESGVYSVDLIVGDSFIQNPFSWTVAKVQITFSVNNVQRPENPFNAKPEIKHAFRAPERRASAFLSFVFTIASLAPWAVLVIGLPLVGANISNFPIGSHTLFAFAFEGCLGLVLLLIANYWLGFANMFQTLQSIGVVLVPGVFFAIQTLNHLATKSAASKKKTE